jgi:non-ribosomal peptide synthase protein (TIGR01720 family)
MQLASRARKVGLILSPKDIFEHQSVAALARIVRLETGPRTGDDAPVGPCRQTPILSAFLEQHGVVGQFCQYRWLQTPASLRLRDLSAVVQALLDRHDALRMRVHAPQENQWQLEIPPPGAVLAAACLTRRDIRSWSAAGLQESATEELFAATRGLSPTRGVLLQAVWFDAGDRPGRLLLVVHHWAIDGVSWRVLLPDLESAWRAVVAQQNIQLDATGNSFRNWAERLYVEAHSPARAAELDYWKRIVAHPDTLLSQRRLEPRDTVATRGRIQLHMPPLVTRAVLSEVPALFHARINDVLLTALALAIRVWRRATGTDRSISAATGVRVDVEGHGRESLFEGLDWSRTVGWFTSEFPAWLDTGELDLDAAMNGRAPVGQALKRIKEQLRELPDHGIGFGLLLHINGSTASHLRSHAPAQIGFNYMGRFDGVSAADWSPAPELDGVPEPLDATLPLTHSIVLDAVVNDRLDGPHLEAAWTWAANLFDEEAIRRLGSHWFEALRSLVEYARQPGAGGLTPSDLSLLQLKQSEIDSLEAEFSLQSLPSDLDES